MSPGARACRKAAFAALLAGTACGCGESPAPEDGGNDGSVLALCEQEEPPHAMDPVARGEYLVRHVAGCGECHTPRREADAQLDMTRWLAGAENVLDVVPEDPTAGAIHAPNLTSDPATGIGEWTDEEIRRAFLMGISRDGSALHPFMPYVVFHHMTSADADAIVAYLRTVDAVENEIPPREELPFELDAPASPVPPSDLPRSTLASGDPSYACAVRGEYLVTRASACIPCHTEELEPGTGRLDLERILLGFRPFAPRPFGVDTSDRFADAIIYSRNLTPHENGIGGFSAQQVRIALQQGFDREGFGLFAPMPSGPMGAFDGMSDGDALAIGVYLTTLPPRDNGVIPRSCVGCHGEERPVEPP